MNLLYFIHAHYIILIILTNTHYSLYLFAYTLNFIIIDYRFMGGMFITAWVPYSGYKTEENVSPSHIIWV